MQEKEKVRQAMVPYLVLGLFAGLRPEEAQKMRWEWIEPLDEEKRIAQVKVPAEISRRLARADTLSCLRGRLEFDKSHT